MHNFFAQQQNAIYSPYYQLAWEEAVAQNFCQYGWNFALRFWYNIPTVVVGRSQSIAGNVRAEVVQSFQQNFDKIQQRQKKPFDSVICLARRQSGGGTVYHDYRANLNYSIFLSLKSQPEYYSVSDSYCKILGHVVTALQKQNIHAFIRGKSDLCLGEVDSSRKISGCAQFRKKNCLVHHGSMLLQPEIITGIDRYLTHPPEEPEYRQGRSHQEFLCYIPASFSVDQFFHHLLAQFSHDQTRYTDKSLADLLPFFRLVNKQAKQLMLEKYLNTEFIYFKP